MFHTRSGTFTSATHTDAHIQYNNEKKGMNVPKDLTHKDKKYEQLDSNIFGTKAEVAKP